MNEFEKKLKTEDNKKLFAKKRYLDSKMYNDNYLIAKDQSQRVMYEQRRSYEKSLLEKAKQELEDEKVQKQIKKVELKKQNDELIKENERIQAERKKLKAEEIVKDQEYSRMYIDMLEKEQINNKNRKKVYSTLEYLPKSKQNNIYGLTVAQEEGFMLQRMKQEEAEDKTKQAIKQITKYHKQQALRDALDIQLKEKEHFKNIEKTKNDVYFKEISQDQMEYNQEEIAKKIKKRINEKDNFEMISSQINQKQSKNPELVIDKFGVGGMNREEFLMNKSILNDISKKKMNLMRGNQNNSAIN